MEQKGCLPILAAAANCCHEMADQAARQLRHEQHRSAARAQLAGVQARYRAPRALTAHTLRILQLPPVARGAVPVIALHILALTGEHHAAQGMGCGRISTYEAMGVSIDMKA